MNSKFFEKSEYSGLAKLYKNSPRNPCQRNFFNSSDCEIIQLRKSQFLSISTDAIAIEIHDGLYKNPLTWGYLAVANSVSDLSASGAKPLGMLISAQWEKRHQNKVRDQIYHAIGSALTNFKIPLLGGDSGTSEKTVITTTVFGESPWLPLTRLGVEDQDLILVFGNNLGHGPAVAYDHLMFRGRGKWENRFHPRPDWKMTYKFRKYFKASIDSSDGLFNSLEILAKLNSVKIHINRDSLKLSPAVEKYRIKNKIPIEYFIESDLGDLQTIVAIHPLVYAKIKKTLPFHQILATAHNTKLKQNLISYNRETTDQRYSPLPWILERSKMQYSEALKIWSSQFNKQA